MLRQVAEGVLAHESEFIESNAVVVQGEAGVLLIDAGITGDEMVAIADDLRKLGQPVVAGFSTHPHWDHLLWHAKLGEAPRYGTARCAAAIQAFLSDAHWKDHIAEELPPEIEVPLDLLGLITGLPAEATQIPWDGPKVRIIEHQAHAPGHAALLIEERRVLVAGDMLSDVLIPTTGGGGGGGSLPPGGGGGEQDGGRRGGARPRGGPRTGGGGVGGGASPAPPKNKRGGVGVAMGGGQAPGSGAAPPGALFPRPSVRVRSTHGRLARCGN